MALILRTRSAATGDMVVGEELKFIILDIVLGRYSESLDMVVKFK